MQHSPQYPNSNVGMTPPHNANYHFNQQSQQISYNYSGNEGISHGQHVNSAQQSYNENQAAYCGYHGNNNSQVSVSQHHPQQYHSPQPNYQQNTGYYSNQLQSHSSMSGHVNQQSQGDSNIYRGSYQHMNDRGPSQQMGYESRSHLQTPHGNTHIVPRPPPTQIPHNHNSRMHLSRLRHGSSSSSLISPPITQRSMHGNHPQGQVIMLLVGVMVFIVIFW